MARLAKAIIRWTLYALATGVAALAGFALFAHFAAIRTYTNGRVELSVAVTPERVARGKKIVSLACAHCHYDQASRALSGRRVVGIPPVYGAAYTPNLTRHQQQGLGSYSDGQLAYLLRTGTRPDGRFGVFMGGLPGIADDDLEALIAFLRSDDPWVAPADIVSLPSRPSLLTKMLHRLDTKRLLPTAWPATRVPMPPPGDQLALGKYLTVGLYACHGCHSADQWKVDAVQPERTPGFLGGGAELFDANARSIYAPNLTFDETTGLGKWSQADLARALRQGFRPDGTLIRYPMGLLSQLADDEVAAIFSYLATVPRLVNPRRADEVYPSRPAVSDGEKLYYKYSCQTCHGDSGLGACDLRAAHAKYPDDAALEAWIRDPGKLMPGSRMPAFVGVIAEADYAPLVKYLRQLGGMR